MFAAPISRTLYQGQVNLLIVALVLMDFFVVSPRARGIGIGVSGAIKLTPAFMALPLLLRKDWAGLTRAVGTFVALSLATFVLWPGPSREYFTQLLFDSGRVGGVAYADNQSLLGAVARFVGPDTAGRVLVVLLVPVLALTAWAVLRQVRAQNVLGQVAAAGLGASLISPVSWSHHWVWLVLASALIARVGHERLAVLMLLPLVFEPGWVASRLPPQLPQLAVASVLALTPVVAIVCLWSLGRAEPRTTDGQ